MNPNGVMFGQGASLNVSGSFNVTTANSLSLGNDGIFYASLGENSVLTASAPSAYGFTTDQPAGISVDETVLQEADGQDITVVGGDITLNNGRLVAKSGNIRLASVASPGEVVPTADGITAVNVDEMGTIEITDTRPPGVVGNLEVSGNIYIRAGELKTYGAFFHGDTFGDQDGGSTDINVDGEVIASYDEVMEALCMSKNEIQYATRLIMSLPFITSYRKGSPVAKRYFKVDRAGLHRALEGKPVEDKTDSADYRLELWSW